MGPLRRLVAVAIGAAILLGLPLIVTVWVEDPQRSEADRAIDRLQAAYADHEDGIEARALFPRCAWQRMHVFVAGTPRWRMRKAIAQPDAGLPPRVARNETLLVFSPCGRALWQMRLPRSQADVNLGSIARPAVVCPRDRLALTLANGGLVVTGGAEK